MPFQTHFDFRHPTRIVHGPGSIACLADCFSPTDKVLIVSDRVLGEIGTVAAAVAALGDIPHAVYLKDGSSEPTAESVEEGAQTYQRERCTAIIGLGGGSSMDVAKMIGVLASNDGRITQYLGSGKVASDLPYLACVPTTYGTASEVTPFAVLDNPASGNKDPVISWKIAPQVGVLDPALSVALPSPVGAATGMDALTHALESYINLAATPLTEGIALHAIRLIGDNLRLACANDHALAATENMLIASMLAGVAFSQTRLGNVHAMSPSGRSSLPRASRAAQRHLAALCHGVQLAGLPRQIRRHRRGTRRTHRRVRPTPSRAGGHRRGATPQRRLRHPAQAGRCRR